MAGKKKKNMANRLAKMSDDERARFLQHKADMEEEAKKRKEQLISTFMKKKIKKEEGFSRLNLAKINQNWHQILRKDKCKEMRQNVEHMKHWMNRVYQYKNRIIEKLIIDLEEAEEQYSYNFQSHRTHINNIIEEQHNYIEKLNKQYEQDLDNMVAQNRQESDYYLKNLTENDNILKTIIHSQSTTAKTNKRSQWEGYMLKLNQEKHLFNEKLRGLKTTKALESSAIWEQIAQVIRTYVEQTDVRRMHFVELKCLDKDSLDEISKNNELILLEETEIERLKSRFENLYINRENRLTNLTGTLQDLNDKFFTVRKDLKNDLALDKTKLLICTSLGDETIKKYKEDLILGEQLLTLTKTCQKYETEREQVLKWAPMIKIDLKELEELTQTLPALKRPKTSIPKITFKKSKPEQTSAETLEDFTLKTPFDNLQSLEKFWYTYNKVNVDFLESKQECKILQNENKELRGMIRAILESALLKNSIPNTRASTRAPSRMRSAFSAPPRRILFK